MRRQPLKKPFPWSRETVLKQKSAYPVRVKEGDRIMQFILELIWENSRSKYLAGLPKEKRP